MSECNLTPGARAFSAMMSAFIGSVVNGLTSGALIAFITAWISWFALFRVVIDGLYMFYRSTTGTWTLGKSGDDYEMLDRALSSHIDYSAYGHMPNQNLNSQNVESELLSQAAPTNLPPTLSELQTSSHVEEYHLHAYIAVFGHGGSSIIKPPKESLFSTIWPTRSDLVARNENALLAQQKCKELRLHYASDKNMEEALAAFALMAKSGTLPGPVPDTTLWDAPNRDVTFLGWVGWVYSAIYSLISQIIWVAASTSDGSYSGAAKLVKGLSIAVTALPLCIDNRVRFAESLRTKRGGGSWAYHAFNLINSTSCLAQGILSGTLLAMSASDMAKPKKGSSRSFFPTPLVFIYPIFSLLWAWVSFKLVPMMDGGRPRAAQKHWTGYFIDVGMGIFGGLFLAAPAFALYRSGSRPGEDNSGASDLAEFLRCQVPAWQKFSAIFP